MCAQSVTEMARHDRGPWFVTFAAALWAVDAPFRKLLTFNFSSTAKIGRAHV